MDPFADAFTVKTSSGRSYGFTREEATEVAEQIEEWLGIKPEVPPKPTPQNSPWWVHPQLPSMEANYGTH